MAGGHFNHVANVKMLGGDHHSEQIMADIDVDTFNTPSTGDIIDTSPR